MLTGKWVLVLGSLALISACSQPSFGIAQATGPYGFDTPFLDVQQAADTSPGSTGIEDAILGAMNAERASNGLVPYTNSEDLRRLARENSQDMVTRQFFSHTNPDGLGPSARVRNGNVAFSSVGETIHFPDVRPLNVVADWLRHPGGKAQLLSNHFTQAGVGVSYSSAESRYYVTAIYMRP